MIITANDPGGLIDTEAELTGVAGWAVDMMELLGEFGAGVAIALENLFPPLPSELILPLGGFAASQGTLNLWLVLFWTTAGSVVGASILYGLGAWLGLDRLRKIVDWLPLVEVADVDKTVAWFERHGAKAVFFGRMIPIFRSLISIPAGVTRMHFGLFLVLTTIGSLIWNSIFVVAGFLLGENWEMVEPYADVLQYVVLGAVVVALVVFVIVRLRTIRRRKAAGETAESTEA